MSSPSKQRGTRWESAIVDYLIESGWPHAERRTLSGAKDKGDIAGLVGVCIEAKSHRVLDLASWIREVETEARNAGAAVAAVWAKRVRKTSPGDGYVIMTGAQFAALLKEAGY